MEFQRRIPCWIFLSFIICVAAEPRESFEESGVDTKAAAEHELERRSPSHADDESPESFESDEEEVEVNRHRRGSYYDYRGEDDYFPDPGNARHARAVPKPKPILGCMPENVFCQQGKECCTGICAWGACAESSCTPLGKRCSYGRDCCSLRCKGSKCVPCPPHSPYC